MKKSSMLVVLVTLMFVGIALTGAIQGASTGGSGDSRYVELVVDDDTISEEYETTVNLTIPEIIHDSYVLTGTFAQVRSSGYNGSISTTLTIVFSNATDVTTTYNWYKNSTVANATAAISITTDLPAGEYNVTSVLLSDDGSGVNDEYTSGLNVTVLTSMAYMMQVTTVNLLLSLLPIIVLFVVVLPVIFKMLKSVGEEASN